MIFWIDFMAIHLRKRHRLRRKEIKAISESLNAILSDPCFSTEDTIDSAELEKFHVLLVDGEILGMIVEEVPFLTVKGLLKFRPQKRFVTIDMGAVQFIYNGADVMSPGIVDADPEISSGDVVWIRDERNLQPLAVGRAMISGPDMKSGQSGKAVKSLHHVGDEIWNYEP
jgi:PUA domain protein